MCEKKKWPLVQMESLSRKESEPDKYSLENKSLVIIVLRMSEWNEKDQMT